MALTYDEDKFQWAQNAAVADLTHTVGTADGTVDDVGASFNQTTLNNNFKELSAKVNAILLALRDSSVLALD
ncbi:hypothetical protein ACIF83_10130 [Streptomyces sp. NPDC085866]|uniref:hypothetical protein n=1 Tax=Streptomyces sp. NPDC085866 TaxID=3365736 RepID=UPI0037D65B97